MDGDEQQTQRDGHIYDTQKGESNEHTTEMHEENNETVMK